VHFNANYNILASYPGIGGVLLGPENSICKGSGGVLVGPLVDEQYAIARKGEVGQA